MTCTARILYATCPDAVCAGRIGRALVDERLAACANLIPGLHAIYRWEGVVEEADEVVLLVKTEAALAAEAGRRLRELHPYAEPCVLELPVVGGSPSYLAWIAATCGR
jgi:periplasmic divalent cation tolerance protein